MFEELIPELQEPARQLVQAAGEAKLHPRVTSTIRGRTEQARLYRRYKSGLAKYPVAPPGTSAHEFGFAFDMVCTPLDALADVGYTWTTWGGIWHPEDEVHFEYPGFVPPHENIVQAAAEEFSKLPWWASVLTPITWATKTVDETEQARIAARACQLFGIGCNR